MVPLLAEHLVTNASGQILLTRQPNGQWRVPHPEVDTHAEERGWFHTDNLPGVDRETAAFLRAYGPKRPHLPRAEWLSTTPRAWMCTAAVVTAPDGRLLMVKAAGATMWNFAGGMLDSHEAAPEGAARELREETGLDLAPGRLLAVSWQHPEPGLDHPIVQFFHDFGTVDPDRVQLSCEDGEIEGWGWFLPAELDCATGATRAKLARVALGARKTGEVAFFAAEGQSAHSQA